MKLNDLHKKFSSIREIQLIGKEIAIGDKLGEIMGLYLYGNTLKLLLLEYDEKLVEYEQQQEEQYPCFEQAATNRILKHQQVYQDFNSALSRVSEIVIDDISYNIEQSGATRATLSDYENTFVLSRFFEKGWQPQGIGETNIENCFLCTGEFVGEFDKIPSVSDRSKIIFKFRDDQKAQIVEQPITLEVGKEYSEKIHFTAKDTGEQHWIYINSVSVYDMLTETMKNFENPKWAEQLSEKELAKMKADTERRILEVCLKGQGFLSIEYESDCDEQIDFYSKEWLDSEPVYKDGATAFMARADKKTGKLGKYLRVALIEQPLELDAESLEAEIFLIYKTVHGVDFVI
ncbi:MAG: hypothetical protein RR964_09935 [Lachnospiraceae bacterium]